MRHVFDSLTSSLFSSVLSRMSFCFQCYFCIQIFRFVSVLTSLMGPYVVFLVLVCLHAFVFLALSRMRFFMNISVNKVILTFQYSVLQLVDLPSSLYYYVCM